MPSFCHLHRCHGVLQPAAHPCCFSHCPCLPCSHMVAYSPATVARKSRGAMHRPVIFSEVVSGIQTVKNPRLRSRWQCKSFMLVTSVLGFKSVLTSTQLVRLATSINFRVYCWVGAYLVLQGKLTLGQLIAFRIIASYTTSPLRVDSTVANFQETALSLERQRYSRYPTGIRRSGASQYSYARYSRGCEV